MIINVLNEGRRTITKRDTGASNWSVIHGKRLAIIEDMESNSAIVTLNSNHQIIDTWFYSESPMDQRPQLFIRVKVGKR